MKIDPVRYYYKNLETGVEMEFTKYEEWGWAMGSRIVLLKKC